MKTFSASLISLSTSLKPTPKLSPSHRRSSRLFYNDSFKVIDRVIPVEGLGL
ncbi:hypothetical protein LINPERPRIM_LOCUS276 [Linum perenne]